jgi:hypothetical protein
MRLSRVPPETREIFLIKVHPTIPKIDIRCKPKQHVALRTYSLKSGNRTERSYFSEVAEISAFSDTCSHVIFRQY